MSLKAVRKAGKKYAKRYARITVISVVTAVVVTAVVGAVGEPRRISLLSRRFELPVTVGVFLQTFAVCFMFGLLVRVLGKNAAKLKAFVSTLVTPLFERWSKIARRTQALIVGILAAVVAGGLTAVVSFYMTVPLSMVAGVCLFVWPVGTYWTLARRPTRGPRFAGWSRYAELRQLETRMIALLIGYMIASTTGIGLWWLGVETGVTAAIAGLVWVGATVVAYNRYETVLSDRTELSISDAETSGEEIELSMMNQSHETIELVAPTIRDTARNRYQLAEHLTIQPGEKASVNLPSTFKLAPTDIDRTLPLGYTLDRSQPAPTVYSRTGSAFELQRGESADEPTAWSDDDLEYAESAAVPKSTHSQD